MSSHRVVQQHYNLIRTALFAVLAVTIGLHVFQSILPSANVLDSCIIDRSTLAVDTAATAHGGAAHAHPHSATDVDPVPPSAAETASGSGSGSGGGVALRKPKKKSSSHDTVMFGLLHHHSAEQLKWWCLAICFAVLCYWPEESYEVYYYQSLAHRLQQQMTTQQRVMTEALNDYPPVWSGYGLSITYVCLSYLWYLAIYFLCNAVRFSLSAVCCLLSAATHTTSFCD